MTGSRSQPEARYLGCGRLPRRIRASAWRSVLRLSGNMYLKGEDSPTPVDDAVIAVKVEHDLWSEFWPFITKTASGLGISGILAALVRKWVKSKFSVTDA